MSFERLVEDMKKAEDAGKKFEGTFTKMGKAVEGFMNATSGPKGFFKSALYGIKGMYTVMNKTKVSLIAMGKVYDTTIGGVMSKNSLLGKSMEGLSKIKMPNFAKGLGGMLSGAKGVAGAAALAQQRGLGPLETLGAGVKKRASEGFSKRGDQVMPFIESGIESGIERAKKVGKFLKGIEWTKKAKGLYFGVGQLLKVVLSKAFNFFIITILALVAIGAFVKIFWTAVQGFYNGFMQPFEGFFESIQTAFSEIWEGVKTIFSFFTGDASLQDMIFAVLDIAFAFIKITLEFLTRLLLTLLNGVVSAVESLVMGVVDWFSNLGVWKQVGVAVVLLGAVVLWLFSVPVILPVIILGALYMFGKWLVDKIGFAKGGIVDTSMQIVGEKGPEFVSLPRGSRVHTNAESKRMVRGPKGGTTNINITINARDTSDGEMRRIASKIGDMVNNKINRTTSSRTFG